MSRQSWCCACRMGTASAPRSSHANARDKKQMGNLREKSSFCGDDGGQRDWQGHHMLDWSLWVLASGGWPGKLGESREMLAGETKWVVKAASRTNWGGC